MGEGKPLEGKVALVTGASKGIGRSIAVALGRAGCDVGVNYFSDTRGGAQTAEEIRGFGRRSNAYQADVAQRVNVNEMVSAVYLRFPAVGHSGQQCRG